MMKKVKTISVFMEEMKWHRATGASYFIARQRTIDYQRRYTDMESPIDYLIRSERIGDPLAISPDCLLVNEGSFVDANLTPESRALFNDLVRQLLTEFVKRDDFEDKAFVRDGLNERIATLYLARILRIDNLEHILDDDLQQIVNTALGDTLPWTMADFASLCGYCPRKGSRINSVFEREISKIQFGLREFLRDRI
jgi:hypothetical protein